MDDKERDKSCKHIQQQKAKNNKPLVVEILIAVAKRGGVENIIKTMLDTLESPRMHFRVVQLVWEGEPWLDASVEFYPLLKGRNGHNYQEFACCYAQYMQSRQDKPDVILAAGWPYMCTIAREVVTALGLSGKIVSWLHCPIEQYQRVGYGSYEQLMSADAHFAINNILKNQFQAKGLSPIYPVYNPVDYPDTDFPAKEGLFHRLLFIGRLAKEKNAAFLFYVLQKEKHWKLRLIGDGDERHALQQLAQQLEITRQLEWVGWRNNPWEYAKRSDAMVISSVYETGPLTTIEAWGRGIPVISTPVGTVPELLVPGQNGYLYAYNDIEGFRKILRKIEQQNFVVPDRSVCRQKVQPYQRETALRDMEEKIRQIADFHPIETCDAKRT
ncbi:MAG: glycosyltransferase [Clostridiaceae bacterium]|nr:glycosyltransferase [Clostridiaceae bacterium]